ncbi:SWIM zinc finger family protein [Ktedonospora formicarum]|uniref:SWIM-type domain-containing protein n=1 Tax=Ktedonospora formicarum TaxID=2778364 RepID=A0A8J3MR88_9CHLR|nr:SWIM zinc finger family protein [Ktedonospora formicarum]GHO45702.1 hypothetical protein KSX_38650 [Ktedonospora formicarum]
MGKHRRRSRWGYYPDDDYAEDDEFEADEMQGWESELDEDSDYSYRRYYNPWEHTTPIRSEGGIKAKSKRGKIGETWWSRRWIQALEEMGVGSRLARGRSYARQGQVLSLDVQAGRVNAVVQGSSPRPYKVVVKLSPLSNEDWEIILNAMTLDALLSARLLAGEMPREIDELFTRERISLFPEMIDDLQTNCSCPDYANPCKHIAAVYYILAERFDSDPFLLLTLRGRNKDEISEVLRSKRSVTSDGEVVTRDFEASEQEPQALSQPLDERVHDFWLAGDEVEHFALRPAQSEDQQAMLRELGESPYVLDGENLTSWLGRMYQKVALYAHQRLDEGY